MAPHSSERAQRLEATGWGLVCLLVLAVPLVAQQADRTQAEALARRATERLQTLQREADRLAAEERTLLGDLSKLEIERQLRSEELRGLDAEAIQVRSDLAAITERAENLRRQEAATSPELRARIVDLYKLGRARYLRLLLATSDARRLGEASRAVAILAQLDRSRLAAHQRTVDGLKDARARLEDRERALASLRAEAAAAQAAAARAAQAKNRLIRDIDLRRDLNADLAGELQAAQQKLQLTLRAVGSTAPSADTPALPLRPFKGDLDWPVVGGTVRRRFEPTASRRAGASPGIEIAASEGTPALAVHDGVVAFAGTFAGFGNLVILDHGSQTFSVYGHLLEITVTKGARVEHGRPIGSVGTPPAAATGSPGLYFELRVDGQPVDPVQWLKKR